MSIAINEIIYPNKYSLFIKIRNCEIKLEEKGEDKKNFH